MSDSDLNVQDTEQGEAPTTPQPMHVYGPEQTYGSHVTYGERKTTDEAQDAQEGK